MTTSQSNGRLGLGPIFPVDPPVTFDVMLNFDGHTDGDGYVIGKCKQTFTVADQWIPSTVAVNSKVTVNSRFYCMDKISTRVKRVFFLLFEAAIEESL